MGRFEERSNLVGKHAIPKISKMQVFEARHPGMCDTVGAMFEVYTSVRAIAATIQAQYGERISHTSIWTYRRQFWNERRNQMQATQVALGEAR
jgi:hypothetical protein